MNQQRTDIIIYELYAIADLVTINRRKKKKIEGLGASGHSGSRKVVEAFSVSAHKFHKERNKQITIEAQLFFHKVFVQLHVSTPRCHHQAGFRTY
jgi:hypothetical protein